MKKNILYLLPVLFCFFLQGCLKDKLTRTYTMLTPVYKEKAEVHANIKSNAPAAVQQPGKIFMYGNYIFLNDLDKGVHVIDNSDPANPVMKAFINIPGNLDIAVKGNTLYADLYNDLVVVDITNPLEAHFVKHIENIFPERGYSNGFVADRNRVIVDWIKKDTTVIISGGCNLCDVMADTRGGVLFTAAGGGAITGVAGSMARFSIVNNYMYTVNSNQLTSFDISATTNPVKTATQQVGQNIETIYPFSGKLFIGSMNAMYIYDLSNPATPARQGLFNHFRSCDPVIADGNYAWVTLRSGNTCAGIINQLDVINISNVMAPSFVRSYPLTNPHGLTKDNDVLFICDGNGGLKMFDAAQPTNIIQRKHLADMETYDAIANNGNLLVVAKDGLYQYGYAYPSTLNFKSKIAVKR